MDLVNRALVLLIPKEPYLEWANSFEDDAPKIAPDEVREHATAFLIPAFDLTDDMQEFVAANAQYLFEEALWGWMTDEETWPPRRDYSTLRDWFEIEIHEPLIDVADEPIRVERDV